MPNSLVIYAASGKAHRTFHRVATRISRIQQANCEPVNNGAELLEVLARYTDLDRVTICCHGGTRWLLHPGRGVHLRAGRHRVTVEEMGLALRCATRRGAVIGLAACLCGASPWRWRWGPWSFASGGKRAFACQLRDASLRTILAHSTKGHTTRNPCLRRAETHSDSFEADAVGLQPLSGKTRRQWCKWTRTPHPHGYQSYAEAIIAGVDVDV